MKLIALLSQKSAIDKKIIGQLYNDKVPHPFYSGDILRFVLIIALLAALIGAVSAISNYFAQRRHLKQSKKYFEQDGFEAVMYEVNDLLFTYHRMAVSLHTLYVLLGATTILSSVFVTTFLNSNATLDGVPLANYLPLISFISTSSITLISAFSLGNKANSCRRAWRLLSSALDTYRTAEDKQHAIKELIKKRDEAETIIGGVDFKY